LKKVYSGHHVVPRSRDASSERVVELPKLFHTALHVVFENLYGQEMITFIQVLNAKMERQETITPKELNLLRQMIRGDKK
jgi:hypothetical protein